MKNLKSTASIVSAVTQASSQTRRLSIVFLVLAMSGLFANGCATPNRMTHLKDTLRSFNQQVRWGIWASAAAHVEQKQRQAWLENRLTAGRDLKMSDVRLVRVVSDGPLATKAQVIVTLTWYRISDMKLQSSHWMQTWKHTQRGWKLTKEERHAKAPLPTKKAPKTKWP